MHSVDLKTRPPHSKSGFTLIEMLVVIAIMSILMTAGAIGLSGMGGKGVASGVASTESLFEEARAIAVGQRTRVRLLISHSLTNNPGENLRRVLVASEELDAAGVAQEGKWVLSSRGVVLPDQVYFSQDFSKKDQQNGNGSIDMMSLSNVKSSYQGEYYFYELNAEGICSTPGASLVIGTGSRSVNQPTEKPRVTSAGKRDFGGFVIWRNGRTSLFHSPAQISSSIQTLNTGAQF